MPPTTNTSTRARNSACCTTTGWRTSPTTGLSGSPIPSGPGPAHPRPRERCSAMPGASGWPSGSPCRCRGPCTRAGEDGAFGDGAARLKVDEDGGMTRFFEYSSPAPPTLGASAPTSSAGRRSRWPHPVARPGRDRPDWHHLSTRRSRPCLRSEPMPALSQAKPHTRRRRFSICWRHPTDRLDAALAVLA